MKKYGINRVSVGVESFNDSVIKFLGRNHDKKMVFEKIGLVKKYFDNINIDLIYAAYDDINILKSDIDCFLKLDIPHISTYSLIIEDNTMLKINGMKNIDEDIDYEMYQKVMTLKEDIKEVLITDENLNNVEKETLLQEAALIDLKTNTEKLYSSAITEYDIVSLLNNLKTNITVTRDEIKKYIDDSNITAEVNGENTTTKVYDVTSTETLDYMNNLISTLDQKIIKYTPKSGSTNLPEEVINKAEVISAGNGEVTNDERKDLLEELVKLYKEYTLKENDFYLVNINSYQVDTTSKISSIINATDENIVSAIKYMYLELPDNLEKYSKLNNNNFNNEVKKVTISLKEEIKRACSIDTKINEIYNKINKNELENSSRE
jgi:hypothetical protein